MMFRDESEIKLLERIMELIERAFTILRHLDERDEQLRINLELARERKAKLDARKQKQQQKEEEQDDVCN